MNSSSGTTAAPVAATPRPTQRTNSGSVSYSLLWRRPSTTTFSPPPTAADSTRLSSTRVVVQAAPSAAHSTTPSQRTRTTPTVFMRTSPALASRPHHKTEAGTFATRGNGSEQLLSLIHISEPTRPY